MNFNTYLENKNTLKIKKLDFNDNQILIKLLLNHHQKTLLDLSTNIALILSKKTNKNPRIIADKIKTILIVK